MNTTLNEIPDLPTSQVVTVSKEITFDSAHRLLYHGGKCHNLHGHTYKLKITVFGDVDLKTGMVVDFSIIKKGLLQIVDMFDHRVIVNCKDTALVEFLRENNLAYYILETEPTAENMAKFIFDVLKATLNIAAVTVWETPTSHATVTR